MIYHDTFKPRPFQARVIEAVLDNHAAGQRVTVALGAPGSGKELLGQAVGCHLYREGIGDFTITVVPRIALAQQNEQNWRKQVVDEPRRNNEADWAGNFMLFDRRGRIEFIEHVTNRAPLFDPGTTGMGIVTTYSALVSAGGQTLFADFAEEHQGRFLLVVDEAQFCGAADDASAGTRAGQMVELLHHYAAHTLLMTGTPNRSDGKQLVLAEYAQPDENGVRRLLSDVECTYQDGVREGYLREFEFTLVDSRVRRRDLNTQVVTEYDLAGDGSDLREVVRKQEVWHELSDLVIAAVRDKQAQHPDYRGLISCMDQREARNVHAYLRQRYPDLRIHVALSDDGKDAQDALRAFKAARADVLITVRMAFIGYDCKEISVVGVLTNYRDRGHLLQLVGRGLRVWDKTSLSAQTCRIIAPDDPKMQDFIKVLRQEMADGLRERRERETVTGERDTGQERTTIVESAVVTNVRAISNGVELDSEQLLYIDSLAREHGISEDRTKLFDFLRAATLGDTPAPSPSSSAPARTLQERVGDLRSETKQIITDTLSDRGIHADHPDYTDYITAATAEINRLAGDSRTPLTSKRAGQNEELCRRRRDAARAVRSRQPQS